MTRNIRLTAGILIAITGAALIQTALAARAQEQLDDAAAPITYNIEATDDGSIIVLETIEINAPVTRVWAAYTTAEGYQSWAAPVASVDLRPGGRIRTSYDAEAGLDGDAVNTLKIVNYVPHRLLTLQAEVSDNWPDVLKRDADNLYNVILFDDLGDDRTRVTSYGLGYSDTPELRRMMQFFEQNNQMLYKKLIDAVERE